MKWPSSCHQVGARLGQLIQENSNTLAVAIAVSNEVLCLKPRSLVSSASIYKTGAGYMLIYKQGENLRHFTALDKVITISVLRFCCCLIELSSFLTLVFQAH